MSPSGRKSGSGTGTPLSVDDLFAKDTDELLQMAASEGLETRKQAVLKALVCRESERHIYQNVHDILIQILRRDGQSCPLTGASFITTGVKPNLAHIIPNSIHSKVSATILMWHSLIILLRHSLILSSVLLCSLGQPSVTLFGNS